jgi:hypothetical protein
MWSNHCHSLYLDAREMEFGRIFSCDMRKTVLITACTLREAKRPRIRGGGTSKLPRGRRQFAGNLHGPASMSGRKEYLLLLMMVTLVRTI